MVLLVMIALAMLSLSSIELRQSGQTKHSQIAKANARLALMIAIGELQSQLGPDQRISTEAALFDTDATTPQIDGVANPHWLAVFSTLDDDETSMFQRDAENGGEWDKRTKSPDNGQLDGDWKHGNRHNKAITYLVSGNEGFTQSDHPAGFQDAVTTELLDDATSVELVKLDLPLGNKNRVRVKKVAIQNKKSQGAYAWWVRDLGVAAKVSTPSLYNGKKANANSPDDGGYFRLLASSEMPGKAIHNNLNIPAENLSKIVSQGAIKILDKHPKKKTSNLYWFDITTEGFGVLANVRTGKLKRNLSDYLNRTDPSGNTQIEDLKDGSIVVSPGISDSDYLLGTPNETTFDWLGTALTDSPTWEDSIKMREKTTPRLNRLRQFAHFAENIEFKSGETAEIDPDSAPHQTEYDKPFQRMIPLTIQQEDSKKESVRPIITECTIYSAITTFQRDSKYHLRAHYYPRVTLWNPYNVKIKMPAMSLWYQTTGRWKIKVALEGSLQKREFTFKVGDKKGSGGGLSGSLFMSLEATEFEPGECLVFCPTRKVNLTEKPEHSITFDTKLSASQLPDKNIFFYWDDFDRKAARGLAQKPLNWAYSGGQAGDNFRVFLKEASSNINDFINKPLVQFISGTSKLGANEELKVGWGDTRSVAIENTSETNPSVSHAPDYLTRESLRLRWLTEPQENIELCDTPEAEKMFSSAYFMNWNLRAGLVFKSPFSNTSRGAPLFYGIYSREALGGDWSGVNWPIKVGGKVRGNPFGPHQEALNQYVMYDLPRKSTGLVSLGQLQHAQLTDYVWQSGSPIGNSFADPRMERFRTVPKLDQNRNDYGGWNTQLLGMGKRNNSNSDIALRSRNAIEHYPESERVVYDISHNVNRALWDDYFLTSYTGSELSDFLKSPYENPLPNSRLRLINTGNTKPTQQDLDFHRAAKHLVIDGAFNVNSTSVPAWKALLMATRDTGMGEHPYPSILNPPKSAYDGSDDPYESEEAMAGFRDLSDSEVSQLADKIVEQVKLRGPFLSLSDFVNRRLVDDETGLMGALQAAIEAAGINNSFEQNDLAIDNSKELGNWGIDETTNVKGVRDATNLSQVLKPKSKLAGAPGYLTQADLLQAIGPVISARSDCFLVRAYGESKNTKGKVVSRAYCEAVVQRLPSPVNPESASYKLNPRKTTSSEIDFGRKFVIKSFRWLSPDEI